MNIVVSTAAARTSGALTIYNQFLTHLRERRDGNRYLLFVDREMPQPAMDGVEYADVDLRSWSRRILFDASGCRELCEARGVRPDVLVSLQNTGVRYPGVPQVIYYHNSLPFYPRRWNPLRREERPLFLYAWMYPLFVRASLPAGADVVVQIPFIRRGFVRRYRWPAERIHVLFPDVEEVEPSTVADYPFEPGCAHFVYPAQDFAYKEHRTLLEALKVIRRSQPELAARIRIHLTVAEGQNRRFEAAAATGGVGMCFVRHGYVSHDELLSMCKSAHGLLFPSTVETLGLPLLEAASLGTAVVAADLDYAHEVLGDYPGAAYVRPRAYAEWAAAIGRLCGSAPRRFAPLRRGGPSSWERFFDLVETCGYSGEAKQENIQTQK